MMGIPDDEYDMVSGQQQHHPVRVRPRVHRENPTRRSRPARRRPGAGDLVASLAAARRRRPTEDLTSALVNANVDGEQLTDQELASFFILLVVAGNETTRNAMSHALMLLTEFPEQRALLLEDFDGRIAGAVEEIVRYASPVMFMRAPLTRGLHDERADVPRGRQGGAVLQLGRTATRRCSRTRALRHPRSPNPHVGFGGPGPHFCLGAHLARREITVMLRELFTRVPDITAGEPDRLLSSFINGIKRLPCDFSR